MRKSIFIAAAFLVGSWAIQAQEKKSVKVKKAVAAKVATPAITKSAAAPAITFETETIDYGTVAANSDGKREFVFTNTGNAPLIITGASGSCGCTVPTYPKEPIAPGAKGVIEVRYDTTRAGQPFSKQVTLTTNASATPKVLMIKGVVLPAAAAPVAQ